MVCGLWFVKFDWAKDVQAGRSHDNPKKFRSAAFCSVCAVRLGARLRRGSLAGKSEVSELES